MQIHKFGEGVGHAVDESAEARAKWGRFTPPRPAHTHPFEKAAWLYWSFVEGI